MLCDVRVYPNFDRSEALAVDAEPCNALAVASDHWDSVLAEHDTVFEAAFRAEVQRDATYS